MKAMPKAMIISGLIVGAIFMFLLGSFVPGVGGLIQGAIHAGGNSFWGDGSGLGGQFNAGC